MPVVSVILPVYNGEAFLSEAIESILSQTFTDFELLIVDDGSVDSTPFILNEYAARDTRVAVIRLPRNMGIVGALNAGCQIATGQYIARMDADDVSLPERLERQLAYLNLHPEVGLLGTGFQLIDALGKKQSIVIFPHGHAQIYWSLCFSNSIVHPTVMIRRDLLLRVGGYRVGYPNGEDYDLWRRAATQTRLANLPEALLLLRKHASNLTIEYASDNLSSAVRVVRELIVDVLGRDVSEKVLEAIHNPNCVAAEQRWQTAMLLEELFREFLSRFSLSQEEKDFIVQDMASRLTSLALRKTSIRSIMIIFRALSYSPSTVFRELKGFLWRIKTGTVS